MTCGWGYPWVTKTKDKKRIIVVNKCDLPNKLELNIKDENILMISALDNVELLKNEIINKFNLEDINNKDFTYLSNSRQIALIKKALQLSKKLEKDLNDNIYIDMLEIDIKEICEILNEVIGESYDDKLIDKIFSNFCLGK